MYGTSGRNQRWDLSVHKVAGETHIFKRNSMASNESFSTAEWSGVFPTLSLQFRSVKRLIFDFTKLNGKKVFWLPPPCSWMNCKMLILFRADAWWATVRPFPSCTESRELSNWYKRINSSRFPASAALSWEWKPQELEDATIWSKIDQNHSKHLQTLWNFFEMLKLERKLFLVFEIFQWNTRQSWRAAWHSNFCNLRGILSLSIVDFELQKSFTICSATVFIKINTQTTDN